MNSLYWCDNKIYKLINNMVIEVSADLIEEKFIENFTPDFKDPLGWSNGRVFNKLVDLSKHEKHIHSQNGEDGIIAKIFDVIGTTNKYYVEFGTESAAECNTRALRENGWSGLLMDGRHDNPSINLHKEFITAENINSLFEKYKVPEEFDLLSIDIDFNDFHVWKAIDEKYRPRAIVMEYNASHPPPQDKVSIYDAKGCWDLTNYFGGSIVAMNNLAKKKGYTLVAADNRGVNLFFVRNDLPLPFLYAGQVEKLYRTPKYGENNGGHLDDLHKRAYTSSAELLK